MMNFSQYPEVLSGPPQPSAILQPNVFSMPAGMERYVIEGSGAILLPVFAGDTFTIINDEGGQVCEILAADKKGKIDLSILNETPNNDARGLKQLLDTNNQSLKGLRLGMEARNIDLASAQGIINFRYTSSEAKSEATFRRQKRRCIIVVSAPGNSMDFRKTKYDNTS